MKRTQITEAGCWISLASVLGALLLLAACGGSDEPSPLAEPTPPDPAQTPVGAADEADREGNPPPPATRTHGTPVSFSADVEPLVVATCARCHTGNGPGTLHVRFDDAGDVSDNAEAIAALVESRTMPPWPASPASVPFQGDWSLSDAEIDALVTWAADGAPLDVDGDSAITPEAGTVRLEDADVRLVADQGFDGSVGDNDQYRCFVYDPELTEDAWIQQYEFLPDQTAVVHHAIGYIIPASGRERAEELEGEDDAGGWQCFGGSRVGSDEIFLGWAPGQGPVTMPEGAGLRLSTGDFIVIQIHYHFDVDAPTDASAIELDFADPGQELDEVVVEEFLAPAEIPCSPDESGPLCDRDAALARAIERYGRDGVLADLVLGACGRDSVDLSRINEGIASASCDAPVQTQGEIISVLGHEHELGKAFRMTLNPDTPGEVVLLDIPRWHFGWQFNYYPVESITLKRGDWVRIECTWDRSLRDPALEPAYVLWADGTDDEMCFATMTVRER